MVTDSERAINYLIGRKALLPEKLFLSLSMEGTIKIDFLLRIIDGQQIKLSTKTTLAASNLAKIV